MIVVAGLHPSRRHFHDRRFVSERSIHQPLRHRPPQWAAPYRRFAGVL